MSNSLDIFARAAIYFVPFLFALCFHEFSHGLVAKLRGDRTAEMMGRLTLNPIPHMDLIGTLVLPILAIAFQSPIFFGWAKPVPVNYRNLKHPRSDLFWIALAGPLSNIFLAIVGAIVMWFTVHFAPNVSIARGFFQILDVFIVVNLSLAIFNLIPIHPLDGGKVLARFLPDSANNWLETNESILSMILMFLILSGAMQFLSYPIMFGYHILRNFAVG